MKSIVLLFVCFAFIFAVPVYAGFTSSYYCQENCVENKPIRWDFNISNDGENDIEILYVMVKDSIYGEAIGYTKGAEIYKNDSASLSSRLSNVTVISPGESVPFVIETTIPSPNFRSVLYYQFCIVRNTPRHAWSETGVDTEYCYKTNYSLQVMDCNADIDCASDEFCTDKKCLPLNCSDCQYAQDHKCFDHVCCENSHCNKNQVCQDHNCTDLVCDIIENKSMYIVNHTCSKIPCENGSIIVDYSCMLENCSYDEVLLDYSCRKLGCNKTQYPINHTCINLNCTPDEGIFNHSCFKLVCSEDEHILNHTCKKLGCNFLSVAEEHECRINTLMFIEIVLILLVFLLIMVDYKKITRFYRTSFVDAMILKITGKPSDSKSDKKDSDEESSKEAGNPEDQSKEPGDSTEEASQSDDQKTEETKGTE